jgi:sulfatase modifying factor 1
MVRAATCVARVYGAALLSAGGLGCSLILGIPEGSLADGGSSGSGSGSVIAASSGAQSGASEGGSPVASAGSSSEAGEAASPSAGPPSCAPAGPGLTTCGASQESCCTNLGVPGGMYDRTYTNTGGGPTGEADPASVSGLQLDKYLVTVGRFRQFVNAILPADGGAGWLPVAGSGKHAHLNGGGGLAVGPNVDAGQAYEPGWVATDDSNIAPTNTNLACDPNYATWTTTAGSQENLPMNCVNWYEAYAFCIWDGGFLPSEAEWEYAAAGGNQQREYPWGSADPGTSNQYAIYASGPNCYYPDAGTCMSEVNIAPVGKTTQGAGLWGQLDLAGEVWQWNLDGNAAYLDPCTDCANLTATAQRVIRAGSFDDSASLLVPWYRNNDAPSYRLGKIGFRCARSP